MFLEPRVTLSQVLSYFIFNILSLWRSFSISKSRKVSKHSEWFSPKNISHNISFFTNNKTLLCSGREGTYLNHLFLRRCLPHKPMSRAKQDIASNLFLKRKTKTSFLRWNKRKVLPCESYLTSAWVDIQVCALLISSRCVPKFFKWIRKKMSVPLHLPTLISVKWDIHNERTT
jgi:hypothetical protein